MADNRPDVSVVIPAYRAEAFVARAIQSVLDQQGVDPEIIVVVDGLVDRTADIAKGFPKTRVLINEINQGAPAARNRGLAVAQAPYVMFLDADDWVEGPLLQGLVEALDLFQADIAFGPCKTEYTSGQPSGIKSLYTRNDDRPSEINNRDLIVTFMRSFFVEACATLWRSEYIREQDGWNESLVKFQDFEVVHRCLLREAKVALTGKGCGVYCQHDSEHRLTSSRAKARWQSELLGMSLIVNEAKSCSFFNTAINEAIINKAESMMRNFARWADDDIYGEAKEFFDGLGGKKTPGSWAHQAGCFLFGLRRKEQLSYKMAGIKKFAAMRRTSLEK